MATSSLRVKSCHFGGEHFFELLNYEAAPVTADSPMGNRHPPPYDCNYKVPTVAGFEAVVRCLKNGEATGEDCLPLGGDPPGGG